MLTVAPGARESSKIVVVVLAAFLSATLLPFSARAQLPDVSRHDADVLIVGAGVAGLSAALEAARAGASVTVVDMASVFGGHAVMSEGDVTIIDTPLQHANGIQDTADLAYKDFIEWGEDANPGWVRYYVLRSRSEIYDWLTSMGVTFDGLDNYPGNSVPRAHITRGRGLGLVSPLYRECLKRPNVVFSWNTEAVELLVEDRRVTGLRAKNLRTGLVSVYRTRAIILATGGFQTNLVLVREHWPKDLAVPDHLLAGSGVNSVGSGLELAVRAGAALFHLDHQWNYEHGLPDPRYPGAHRGLNAAVRGIRVNARGKLFMPTSASSKVALRTALSQPGATYWSIFDENSKRSFRVSGSDWGDFDTIQNVILDNSDIVKKAATIDELSLKTGLPAEALRETIAQTNDGPLKIDTPPFYAVQFFPLTRKSMGGVSVDLSARVLDKQSHPILGLYAAGELTGEAGINGSAALEGTFLGPSIVMGRVAARSAVADVGISPRAISFAKTADVQPMPASVAASNEACVQCHNLPTLVSKPRVGYWHFERAHHLVLERKYSCVVCHADIGIPSQLERHRINRLAQIDTCSHCHVAQ